ncbi:MAG: tetratricopeptide repeat protein [Methanomicrobiales archaeon]|nr:tetratricopeptide repeat protein [Methanomicrobiales archaeon]
MNGGDEGGVCNWVEKGVECARKGDYREALKCCEKAIEIDPESAEAWLCKCNALKGMGREGEALECYGRAVQINPGIAQAWVHRGNILFKMGRVDEAMDSMDRAKRLRKKK